MPKPPKTPKGGGITPRNYACSKCRERFTSASARDVHQYTCKGSGF